jgi:hypothetical protein
VSKKYAVGYGKPPVNRRFKKGQSGNPTGRPRRKERTPHIEPALKNALSRLVTVNENGKVSQITKFDAVITQLVNKAASGHVPSIKLLMSFVANLAEATSEADREAMAQAAADPLERINERLRELSERNKAAKLLFESPSDEQRIDKANEKGST